MIIQGGRVSGARLQDAPSSLVEYLDAADYPGSGTSWPARVGANATLYAAPTWAPTNGGCFIFTPASLQYADTPWLGNFSNWTAECWFQTSAGLDTTQATAALTTVYDDGVGAFYGQINYCLGNNNPGPGFPYIKAGYYNAVNAGWHETNGFIPIVGDWYQMVGTFDGTTVSTYVNGALYHQASGDGGSVTQLTSKSTAVTLNGRTGRITANAASLVQNALATFRVNNTYVTSANNVIIVNIQNPVTTNNYTATVAQVQTGNFDITLYNPGSTASDAVVYNFAVIQVP